MPPTRDEVDAQLEELGARRLFEKVLSATDVRGGAVPGDRVVMPKRNTETHLPELESQAGVVLDVEDLEGQRYRLRLTYWTNSPSSGRMYILEGTSQLLQHYRLRTGDALVVARTGDGGLLMAGQRKQASRAGATCSRADCINKLGLALTLL
ncbi:hypothetical protein CHLNCDRAFT_138351 [Chlorella variabilis]|uniref:Uncharacterized protein n=1 Tax=Chlorella variabilis TaxID=554065 RepID=E1ZMV1_CHLVA|nr:hypothetical protein CHLNCDRAFT_138351 [Chlorella variabilis]EFN52754.1 hypothetical protein CHLNCDRAFT_138351 [Chlorella variabilis]|eukprot:XP_005844856.1 hypothetical protein CHLNCDRAFT_138351 [Chlorella variabilis]